MPPDDTAETAHALSDFKLFSKFPNCIKLMIWEEFYSQPRYFTTYPVYQGRSREDEFEIPLGWSLKPKGPQKSYHKAIDTQIDQLSSFVASRVRPRFTIEIPRMTVDEHQPHRIKKRRAKGKSKVAHANINWDFDFVHVIKAIPEGSGNLIPQVAWFSNIRNMVLDHDLLHKDKPLANSSQAVSTMSPSHDPEIALSSFELFQKLPNCVKFMIWEDFYLEPRYFFVYGSGNRRFGQTVEWVMKPRPCKKNYYAAIDTEIDPLASIVAGRIRPELVIEVSKGSAKAEHVKINWTVDFVHLRWPDSRRWWLPCEIPDLEWLSKVQNLVLDRTVVQIDELAPITEMIQPITMSLWHRSQSLLSLRKLILQSPSSTQAKITSTDVLCFQIRYLIREAPKTPLQWKDMQVEVGSRSPWLDVEQPGRTPPLQWNMFVESWRRYLQRREMPVTLCRTLTPIFGYLQHKEPGYRSLEDAAPFSLGVDEVEDTRGVFDSLLSDPLDPWNLSFNIYPANYIFTIPRFFGVNRR
ncbi:hypothetical protein CcaCcLH18_02317 [Colletotrichum camelliae]|nr:hypothetical protein CcaCcLH18_02317 [Colletotrichum camelliae]